MARELRNVAASVHARLLRLARDRREELQRLLVLFALERFLYRLGRSDYAQRFVLKGAMLFQVWEGRLPRTTRDLDLLCIGESSEESVLTAIREIWRIEDVNDGLELDDGSLTAEVIREHSGHAGLRIKCRVGLGNAVVPLQIDIGSGDAVRPSAQLIDYPTLLDLPAPRLLAYPKETVVAEKTQAIVELGLLNSRLKDYFDLDHLARTQAFDGTTLREAMRATFDRRATPIPQDRIQGLSSEFVASGTKQVQWIAFRRRAGLHTQELGAVVAMVREFVEPVVLAMRLRLPFERQWPPRGPWHPKQES